MPLQCLDMVRIHEGVRREEGKGGTFGYSLPVMKKNQGVKKKKDGKKTFQEKC